MTAIVDLPAVRQRQLIASRRLSPVELLDMSLARIRERNEAVNAVVTLDEERARAAAATAEARVMSGQPLRALEGLPLLLKDECETEGLRTTWGSRLFANHVPVRDSSLVAALRAAGAIILGKTNMPEFGAGAVTSNLVFGSTGNPFDPDKTCSGSSGGSAVAVASGMASLATGSDFGGSLRTPAHYCGVVGMRPTAGIIPGPGRLRGWSPLSVEGPLARTVADAALLLDAMMGTAGTDPLARRGQPIRPLEFVDPCALRIGFSPDLGGLPIDPVIAEAFADRIGRLAGMATCVIPVEPPLDGAVDMFETLRGAAFLAAHAEKVEHSGPLLGPLVHWGVRIGRSLSLDQVIAAEVAQTRLFQKFQALFDDIDLLLCPAAPVSPFDRRVAWVEQIGQQQMRTYIEWVAPCFAITLTGSPSLCLPMGRDATGMPFGLQLVGRHGDDRRLLAMAAAIEDGCADQPELARPVPEAGKAVS